MVLEDTGNIGESLCTSFWKYNMVNLGKWTKNAWFKKISYRSIIYEEIGFSKFFLPFLEYFHHLLPSYHVTNFTNLGNFTNFTKFTNLLQTFCSKVWNPLFYKPFTNLQFLQIFYKLFTNFLFEVSYRILSFTNLLQTLQTLQTFYKLFPRRYRILCFTNFLQTLQTVQSLQTFCSKL